MNASTTLFALLALSFTFAEQVENAPSPPVVEDATAKIWLKHMRGCLKKVFSIKAKFVQEHRAKHRAEDEKWEGVLEVRRGGRYRLTYKLPDKRLVVSDGETIWAYDREAKTAYSSPAGETVLDDLLALLVGKETEHAVEVRFLGGSGHPDEGVAAIELVPSRNHPFLSSIVLTLEKACPAIRRILVTHHDGSVTRVTLSDIKTNVGMGKRRFMFKPPGGTRVVTP